ncbi:MAG: helix-turn-helix domain-containing protein [Desulfovibrio sp.]|jgi:transcriptional regulator with XRE-family HTH domain|nr:helix-turn-helix domain-containing protein [Desulfovibrio sp.]
MRNPNSFGDLLRSMREQAGKTLKDLAGHMGWSIVYLSDIERGKRNPPNVGDVKKMAVALGIEAATLLDAANRQRNRVELNIGLSRTIATQKNRPTGLRLNF